jgi:phosphoglycerol transferase MdoB-like AlkP superfamily enzyme
MENNLELLGHQPSKVLTLVLFPRVENAATAKNDGFFAERVWLDRCFCMFSEKLKSDASSIFLVFPKPAF